MLCINDFFRVTYPSLIIADKLEDNLLFQVSTNLIIHKTNTF